MKYLVDSADLEKIAYIAEYFPIAGVTTNPSILAGDLREGMDFKTTIKAIRTIIGVRRQLHVQITETDYDNIMREAELIADFAGRTTFIKIPISPVALKATAELKRQGFLVTETAIFTPQQALLAAEAGADYVAPYVNRLDNIIADGVDVVAQTVELFRTFGYPTKVLAASFKSAEQVHKVAVAGAHSVTVNPEIFDIIVSHPMTDAAVKKFDADWKSAFGNQTAMNMLESK